VLSRERYSNTGDRNITRRKSANVEKLLWRKSKIYGIDIDSRCKEFEEENIKIFIGSQSDRAFLKQIKELIPPVDILIDDVDIQWNNK